MTAAVVLCGDFATELWSVVVVVMVHQPHCFDVLDDVLILMIAPWCNLQRLLLKQAKVEVNQSRRMTACVLLLKRVIYGISFYSSTTGSKTAFDGDDVLYMRANLFRLFDARGGLLLEAFSVSV